MADVSSMEGGLCSNLFQLASGNNGAWGAVCFTCNKGNAIKLANMGRPGSDIFLSFRAHLNSSGHETARRLRVVGPTFFRLNYSGYQGYVLLDLTELSSYLPLVSCFEFGNVSGKLFPCTEGRVRTRMVPPGTPRAGAFTPCARTQAG